MATILQQQLAAISANSTNQLDLKAQKAQHAKSLLFDPSDAARQSFDDIYQICIEGFEELCQLDSRFTFFASNLFGESSKDFDRGQLTQKENEECDAVILRFLGLVQGRLLLKPAQKSLEWLVRRWKANEFNTEALLLTLLPYHTEQRIFPALLAILPTDKELPGSFKWLHPYIASLSCPPRHAVLSAIVSNSGLFSASNNYILRSAKDGYASSIALGFWAGLTVQAVNSMLDSSRSGRDAVRKQKEEEILLKVLPIVQQAFTISKKQTLSELFVGSCMIGTVLATKTTLADAAFDAMMEAVAGAWTEQTIYEGLSCLAVIAEEKEHASLPIPVTKAMLKIDNILEIIIRQAESQRVSKLAGGFVIGIVRSSCKKKDSTNLHFAPAILQAGILLQKETLSLLENLLSYLKETREGDVHDALSTILARVMGMDGGSCLLRQAARNTNVNPEEFGMSYLIQEDEETRPTRADEMEIDTIPQEADDTEVARLSDYSKELDRLPAPPSPQYSFLCPTQTDTEIFQRYSRAFRAALGSEKLTTTFLAAKSLRGFSSRKAPNFLTFLARTWTSGNKSISILARFRALQVAAAELERMLSRRAAKEPDASANKIPDLQHLIPYLLIALTNDSPKVRRTAVTLCSIVNKLYGSITKKEARIWAKDSIYDSAAQDGLNLATSDASQFFSYAVMPGLEECVLDGGYVVRSLAETLNSSSGLGSKKVRSSVCEFLAAHAAATPVFSVKATLLRILNEIGKPASAARVKILIPYAKQWVAQSEHEVEALCHAEGVSVRDMDVAVLGALSHRSEAEMELLRDLCSHSVRKTVVEAAFDRLRDIWIAIKHAQVKIGVVKWLMELALSSDASREEVSDHALETLRMLELPGDVFIAMLEALPTVASFEDEPSAPKRQRRSSEADRSPAVDQEKLQAAIRRITLVLELVEASKPESPKLLAPLFHLLAELRQFKTLTGSELVYLLGIALEALLSVVSAIPTTPSARDEVDKSGIRIDLLVECVRSTSSTHIHNTALLLVSSLAKWAPESVLHSVMPLFTFMSSTVLRQSDEYSAHVTNRALTQIVPALAASLKKKGKNLVGDVSELLLSFVAAWEHVPLHRRLALFEMLVGAVGAEECLGAVAAMLVERYSDGHVGLSQFVTDLVNRFDAEIALKSTKQWLDLVQDGLGPRSKRRDTTSSFSDTLLAFSDKDDSERENSIESLMEGLALVLSNGTLRKRLSVSLSQEEGSVADNIRNTYASLLEQVMILTQTLASSSASRNRAPHSLLSSVLGLLPTHDFISSSAQLMQSGSDSIRQQVFRSLEERVHNSKFGNVIERQTFLDVLPSCSVFVHQDQPAEVRMAAIACIDAICEKFGKTDRAAVKAVADSISSPAALGSNENQVRVLSLLCLASVIGVLGDGDESVAILPSIMQKTLNYLEQSGADDVDMGNEGLLEADSKILLDGGFRLLTAVLDHVPWILASAPDDLDRALITAAKAEEGCDAAAEFRALATKKVSALDLLKSLQRTWNRDVEPENVGQAQQRHVAIRRLDNNIGILQAVVQYNSKATITKIALDVFDLLLEAFDLRRVLRTTARGDMFERIDQVALEVTLKLNDATFRPFFVRLTEWAGSSLPMGDIHGRTGRLLSLFSFSQLLFEKLRSLVTSYMGYLLEISGEVLLASLEREVEVELLQLVITTLGASFRNDEDDFWTAPAHFDVVAHRLVDQLRSIYARQLNESGVLITTIADLASNVTASTEQLKALNSALLSVLRHDSADVRLLAVQCQRAITKRVNFDWLALLPELLPAISELQEDDDERVERETLVWVKEIEEISGESLEGMLA